MPDHGSENKPGEKDPEVAARWAKALELRIAGASYQQIATQLGYAGPSGAYQAIESAIDATLREPSDRLRVIEAERLDRLMLPYWRRAIGTKDREPDETALDRVLKIMDRRAKLLGLDAPSKTQIESVNNVASDDALLRSLIAAASERRGAAGTDQDPGAADPGGLRDDGERGAVGDAPAPEPPE